MTTGSKPIGETKITSRKRSGALPGLCAALKEVFITPEWNERIFEIPESGITEGKKYTGRPWIHGRHSYCCRYGCDRTSVKMSFMTWQTTIS